MKCLMGLIDANKLIECEFKNPISYAAFCNLVGRQPTVDAVPVVRCGECRYWDSMPSCSATPQYHTCKRRIMGNVHTMREDFCSQGERKGR